MLEREGALLGETEDQELSTFSGTQGAVLIQDQEETQFRTEMATGGPNLDCRGVVFGLQSTFKVLEFWVIFLNWRFDIKAQLPFFPLEHGKI